MSSRPDFEAAQNQLRVGFVPLLDSAVLIAAREKGFAAAEGLDLTLVREVSWANIRDKVIHGHFDAAHMLAGQPIAASLGIGHPAVPMIAPFCLGLNGNAIFASRDLAAAMKASGAIDVMDPMATAETLAAVVRARAATGLARLRLAMVFPVSCHNYEMRYWLWAAGIDPDTDVDLVVVPPPFMVEAMRAGEIDAFCVGEPWSSVGADAGIGEFIALGSRIWRRGVEKVLGLRADWAERHPEKLDALLRALDHAAAWAGQMENVEELASILSAPAYLNRSVDLLTPGLTGRFQSGVGLLYEPDFLLLHRDAANFPWVSQALWIYSQMVRWRQIDGSAKHEKIAGQVFRPDLYRQALRGSETPMPGASAKLEGSLDSPLPVGSIRGTLTLGSDRFFDGRVFDPSHIQRYLNGFISQKGIMPKF